MAGGMWQLVKSSIWSGNTIAEKAARTGGNTSGFDYLRIFLASEVILLHSFGVVYGQAATRAGYAGPAHAWLASILPMFFGLSGFLVASSLERSRTLRGFLTLRVIRLFPALLVEVALSAFILGASLTLLPLHQYFSSPIFWTYWLNTIGWVHFQLPGVFMMVPQPDVVNRSLWTLPFELECYVALAILSSIGLLKFRRVFGVLVVVAAIAGSAYLFHKHDPQLQFQVPTGRALVVAFLVGVVINKYSDVIRLNWWLAAIAFVVALPLLYKAETIYVAAIPIVYVTVFLGMLTPKRAPIIFTGDYSYGLYLFAFPIQQTLCYLLPGERTWWFNTIGTIALCLGFAALSWFLIEKPFLSHKKKIVAFVESLGRPAKKVPAAAV